MDIDFVMPWVDGSDPNWQAEKAKYQGKTLDDSNSANRFLLVPGSRKIHALGP